MTDRELLELAAKAAGMDGCVVDYNDRTVFLEDGKPASAEWDPLKDDGDALRLAVKLRIDLDFDDTNPIVEAYRKELETSSFCACEALTPDANAATRRAIVRAAAELGKQA